MPDPGGRASADDEGPWRGRKRLPPLTTLMLMAVGSVVIGLVVDAHYGLFGVLLVAWFALVAGLVVVIRQVGGPRRTGETAEAFARRQKSLRRWRIGLIVFLVVSTLAAAGLVALVYVAMNALAANT